MRPNPAKEYEMKFYHKDGKALEEKPATAQLATRQKSIKKEDKKQWLNSK